ncbi:hypothetical protein AB3Y13_08505 [Vibrio alginolyticus]|uniref:hypothetical protein n=1 Tax=Vibrio sp. B1FLJ16 TaxID=2751178 RepID=UPI0015F6A427|nr:hypothetical protein [Vibrio sp. B1FLJ16]CAD7796477.1 hypothetical protein ACOMICROBIO_EPCKBFOG_00005 [Vibrio sp. B1FLJ16]CAE6878411.1 hypothetical protein ACOMICROBIO_EPCKBFOG_00005 [Vibrio sp. B1FLJ16]
MTRVAVLVISLAYSINSNASDFEKKVPCLKADEDVFIGWMTKQECIDQQGASPDMLGKARESEILTPTTLSEK